MNTGMFVRGMIVVLCFLLTSCIQINKKRDTSTPKDLAFTKSGNNIALLFAAPENLDGPPKDIANMKEILEGSKYSFNFKATLKNKATKNQILKITKENAPKADSLFWFFSGHGASDGSLASEDGDFLEFSEIMSLIESARSTPLKRLLIFVDACYAGHAVDGDNPVITESGAASGSSTPGGLQDEEQNTSQDSIEQNQDDNINQDTDLDDIMNDSEWQGIKSKNTYTNLVANKIAKALEKNQSTWGNKVYEQALIFASSTKEETSGDSSAGGYFSLAVKSAISKLFKDKKENATFTDLVKVTGDYTSDQTPVWKAFPAELMQNKLFEEGTVVDSRLFAALEPSSNDARTFMWTAIDKRVTLSKVILCRGNAETCKKNPVESITFQLQNTSVANRSFYKTASMLDIKDNDMVTLMGFDGSNIVTTSTITFKAQ